MVILVLGALNSRKSGAKLAKLLASQFTVISYDRRERGGSTDTSPYAPQREIEDIVALINEAGEQVYLYGHSSGAALVLNAAVKLRKQVKKLAICEAPYSLDADARKAAREYDRQLRKMLAPLAVLTVLVLFYMIPIHTLYGVGDPVMILAMTALMLFRPHQHTHSGHEHAGHQHTSSVQDAIF